MTEDLPALPALSARVPGQAVMCELMRRHELEPARGRLARLVGRQPLTDRTRSWFLGAQGEIAVGRELSLLPQGWHVLHAVPVGKGSTDIDHVVIGPAGLFTLNTKYHGGKRVWVSGRTFMVSGHKQDYIAKSEGEARRAARCLTTAMRHPVHATPVIVVVNPARLLTPKKPDTVGVATASHIGRWLGAQPAVLEPAQVQALLAAADRPGTWHDNPDLGPPAVLVRSAFDKLARDVRVADRARAFWAGGLSITGTLAGLLAGPHLIGLAVAAALR